jgi:hypothetical protein
MHLKELNHRNPLRILDRSVQGGVGAGNLAIVAARAGVGKSGFLTCVALDDLLRGRRVLHVSRKHPVGHVRDFYDEVFADLARTARLEETIVARRRLDENRFIHATQGHAIEYQKLADLVEILRANAQFVPDTMIVDGHDFAAEGATLAERLRDLAREIGAELWMTLRTTRADVSDDWHELPAPVAALGGLPSVIVYLQPAGESVHIRLLRDHDRSDVEDPGLDLDPQTFLIREA